MRLRFTSIAVISLRRDFHPQVSPSPLECAKLGVYQAMMDQGVKKSELAHRLG
jgi:antitoxin HicB